MGELVIKDKFIYSLADKNYYETISRYSAMEADFCIGLKRRIPANWTLRRNEIWMHCTPPVIKYPDQGWKIHLSATPAHASAILATATEILVEEGVAFKFVADRMLLGFSLSKRWSRGGSGKFIAVYPENPEQCAVLLERLHQATIGFNGPYILSDRRYKDSKVVYYRYGGLKSTRRIGPDGGRTLVIADGAGQYVADERTPYFQLLPGMVDPFEVPQKNSSDDQPAGTLKSGRYHIDSVLAYSNSGGVYLATDLHTNTKVVIKEARPFTNVSSRGLDAVQLLKKEHRVLCMLTQLDISPIAIDFFFDWEHAYLVETYLEGARDFRAFTNGMLLTLRTRPTRQNAQEYIDQYCEIFLQIAKIVDELHRREIVFGDLSMANVMINRLPDGNLKIRLIDFEGAHEANVDLAAHLYTPGFSPEEFAARGVSATSDDIYALGSLMLAGLFPMNALLALDRTAGRRFISSIEKDFGIPAPICDLIIGLMRPPEQRTSIREAIEVLEAKYIMPVPEVTARTFDVMGTQAYLDDILNYIKSSADFDRMDRLYPADPEVFSTNPLSLAHGACGIALVQKKITGKVEPEVLDWINRFKLHRDAFSPGLYSGLAGVAWFWLDMGEEEKARTVLSLTENHPYLTASPDIFNGTAGWGLTQLRFYHQFKDQRYLQSAIWAGNQLIDASQTEADGLRYWKSSQTVSAGFGHGAAGICTFLLYLYVVTDDARYLRAGEEGLAWVLSQGRKNSDDALTWLASEKVLSATPYWRWGSSGIGRALLRYWHVTRNEKYADAIDQIIPDADRKYAIFPGYFFGLSGIGEFFLDLQRFDRWKAPAQHSLHKLFAGCSLFAIHGPTGIAFPGESLARISCDLGTGSAGIALVLHRAQTGCGASLMLDEVLPGWSVKDH